MTRSDDEVALAERHGFTHEPDENRGKGWYKFRKEEVCVWQCMHQGRPCFARARLQDERWSEHTYHDTLEEAFMAEEKPPEEKPEEETQSAEEVVAEAKARVAADDEAAEQARAGPMAEVPPTIREVCGAIARMLVDPEKGSKALAKVVGTLVAARHLYAMAVHDLEIRLQGLTDKQKRQFFKRAVDSIVNGELLEVRMGRWFPDTENGTEEERREKAHVLEHERETYEATAELMFAPGDDEEDTEVVEQAEENARRFLKTCLKDEFADADAEVAWSLMQEVVLQAALYQASKPFNEAMLLAGMEQTVIPWMKEAAEEHNKLDAENRRQEIEEWEKARRERPVPLGIRVFEQAEHPEVPRNKPLVFAGWAPAVRAVLDKIMTTAMTSKDAGQLFCIIRLLTHIDDDDPNYRVRQRRLLWLGGKTWEDCTKTNKSWPELFQRKILTGLSEPPDILMCDDLALAGKSHGLVGGTAARKAGHAQKKFMDWCKKAGCLLVGGVGFVDRQPNELETLHSGAEWQQLRDFAILRAITVHDKGDEYRLEIGKGLDSLTMPKEKLDEGAPSRIIIPT